VTTVFYGKVPSLPVPVFGGLAVPSMIISGIPVMGYINHLHHTVKQNGNYMPDVFHLSMDSYVYQNTQRITLFGLD